VHTMVRKTVWVGIFASAMMMVVVGAASAAPPAMSLSSWESTVVDGAIVGGTRTVVITNITEDSLIDQSIDLETAPCDCEIADVSLGQTISHNTWLVPDLAPGESATVTLRYEAPTLRAPAASSNSLFGSVAIVTAMMLACVGAAAMARRPRLVLDF
jgi:hypothetical protein